MKLDKDYSYLKGKAFWWFPFGVDVRLGWKTKVKAFPAEIDYKVGITIMGNSPDPEERGIVELTCIEKSTYKDTEIADYNQRFQGIIESIEKGKYECDERGKVDESGNPQCAFK